MECDKCGFNPTVEQVYSVRLEKIIDDFAKFLKDTISADMLFHPSHLKKHFESKIAVLTGKDSGGEK